MKTHICPYLNSQNRCTHRLPLVNLRSKSNKLPDCIFFNPKKCELYNQWINELKRIRELENPLEDDVYDGHRVSTKRTKLWKK